VKVAASKKKVLLKTAEELVELSARILQEVNKTKDYSPKILEEVLDVEVQLRRIRKIYENTRI
tara:strand:- start:12038 stop:12226 length:189 start_codon:yes stop_codon:yes gene_type:complete